MKLRYLLFLVVCLPLNVVWSVPLNWTEENSCDNIVSTDQQGVSMEYSSSDVESVNENECDYSSTKSDSFDNTGTDIEADDDDSMGSSDDGGAPLQPLRPAVVTELNQILGDDSRARDIFETITGQPLLRPDATVMANPNMLDPTLQGYLHENQLVVGRVTAQPPGAPRRYPNARIENGQRQPHPSARRLFGPTSLETAPM